MWFRKEKLAQAARSNNFKLAWLAKRLGCSESYVSHIWNGDAAATYRIAKGLLEVFGYDAVMAAIDWGRTKYAG